jgi:hypothetical protein
VGEGSNKLVLARGLCLLFGTKTAKFHDSIRTPFQCVQLQLFMTFLSFILKFFLRFG